MLFASLKDIPPSFFKILMSSFDRPENDATFFIRSSLFFFHEI